MIAFINTSMTELKTCSLGTALAISMADEKKNHWHDFAYHLIISHATDASSKNASAVLETLLLLLGNAKHTELVRRGLECFSPSCWESNYQNVINRIK